MRVSGYKNDSGGYRKDSGSIGILVFFLLVFIANLLSSNNIWSLSECQISSALSEKLWTTIFLLSVFFGIYKYVPQSIFLFLFLLVVSGYFAFYGFGETSTCEDFATSQVCANTRKYDLACNSKKVRNEDTRCDFIGINQSYTPAFFPTCSNTNLVSPFQKKAECSNSTFFFYLFAAGAFTGCVLTVFRILISK